MALITTILKEVTLMTRIYLRLVVPPVVLVSIVRGCSMLLVVKSAWVARMALIMMSIVVLCESMVSRKGLVVHKFMVGSVVMWQ